MNTKHYIKSGWGFSIGQDFARATKDTPVQLAEKEYAGGPRWVQLDRVAVGELSEVSA